MPNPAREGPEQGVEVRCDACDAWERHGEGANVRPGDTLKRSYALFISLSVNPLTSVVVTEQVPINIIIIIILCKAKLAALQQVVLGERQLRQARPCALG